MKKASVDRFGNLTDIKPIDFKNYFGAEKVSPSTPIIPRAAITNSALISESKPQPKPDANLSKPDANLSSVSVSSESTPSPIIDSTPEPEKDDSNQRFLARLLGQGVAMFGAGIAGRNPMQVAEQFNEQQFYSDRLAQSKENEKYNRAQREAAIEQAKLLMNPASEESKRKRLVYEKSLGIKIPPEFSASDLEDRNVLQGLIAQSQPKTVLGRGGGLAQLKPEKEIKSNQKSMAEYRDHVASLSEMGNVLNNIKLLNRTAIGTITPDFATNTQAYSSSLDRAAQPMIKTLAGPGTLQKEERDTYGKLVPTGNTRADLALRQANDIIIEGTNKSLSKMNTDLSTGDISKKDYDALINEYNEQLTKKGIGINQVINPSTGRLEPREKKEATLKNGKKVLIDQFGYTWE